MPSRLQQPLEIEIPIVQAPMRVLETEPSRLTAASGDTTQPVPDIIREMWTGALAELDAGRARLAAYFEEASRAAS